jgi:hypothetical protein
MRRWAPRPPRRPRAKPVTEATRWVKGRSALHAGRQPCSNAYGRRSLRGRAEDVVMAATLQGMGYEDIVVLDGGLKGWAEAGLPTNEHE